MKVQTVLAWMLVLAVCLARAATVVAADVDTLADKVQSHYKSVKSFTADFTQVLKNATSKDQEIRTGHLAYAQPNLIRWETRKPEKELLVVGKDGVWNVFDEERTAYRYGVEEVLGSKTMLRFLSGAGNIADDFTIEEEPDAPAGETRLKLTPREAEPGMVLAHIDVDTKTYTITRAAIEDFYGNVNDVTLKNIKMNPVLSKDLFVYTPPKDYQTFDNTGATQGRILTK
ncbi:outer membrane lipoprotein chaperone LolA [Fundidesulfovibrio butyratiphilus]